MKTQERQQKLTNRTQLREAADMGAAEVIDWLISQYDGNNYCLLKHRPDMWPPIDTAESEPLSRLVAARELEYASRALQPGYIREARATGRSWYEIGMALDLLWQAVVNKESVADEAYDYTLRLHNTGAAGEPYTWTCNSCRETITDHGPWSLDPAKQEEGHATNCPNWTNASPTGSVTTLVRLSTKEPASGVPMPNDINEERYL
jgi:hypothetical protein